MWVLLEIVNGICHFSQLQTSASSVGYNFILASLVSTSQQPIILGSLIFMAITASWMEKECREIHDSLQTSKLSKLINAMTCKNRLERQLISDTYKVMYGKELSHVFKTVKNGSNASEQKVNEALSLWMLDLHERDAILAREALCRHADVDYKVLVEIFAGRKSSQIALIKQVYRSKFRRQLEQDIIDIDPPNAYQKIIVALATSHKAHHTETCQHIAKCDAKRLYKSGGGGSEALEEAVILEILSKRSLPQMKLTCSSYKSIYGQEYSKAVKKGRFKEFEEALIKVIKCVISPPSYYAKELYNSLHGSSSDRSALLRVLISRSEMDMDEIKKELEKKHGKRLTESICDIVPPGDYLDFLVGLATGNKIHI